MDRFQPAETKAAVEGLVGLAKLPPRVGKTDRQEPEVGTTPL